MPLNVKNQLYFFKKIVLKIVLKKVKNFLKVLLIITKKDFNIYTYRIKLAKSILFPSA